MLANLGAPLVGDPFYGNEQLGRQKRQKPAPGGFYLEHILLKYVDFEQRAPRVAHLRDDPDREPIAFTLRAKIDTLID